MRNVLICTVGTSLKGNVSNSKESAIRDPFLQCNAKGTALALASRPPDERLLGAEINSITSILDKTILNRRDFLYLLVSETEDGKFIGEVLKQYYSRSQNQSRFDRAQVRVVEGLTDASAQRFRTEGLRNLVKEIAEVVKRHGANNILINATGGYKAQISFAGMIGQALEIPVCYLFERFSEVIELPPQPISMDLSFWLEHVDVFFDLEGEGLDVHPVALDERFASLADEIEVDGHNLSALSAIGQLFHETFRYRFHLQREVLLPSASKLAREKKTITYEDKNSGKHAGLVPWLEKILDIPYVERIYTHYYNPDLPLRNYFRASKLGDFSQVEGGFSNGKATTKFDVITSAASQSEGNAVLADLLDRFC